MAGYGAVTQRVQKYSKLRGRDLKFVVADSHVPQLERLPNNLKSNPRVRPCLADICKLPFANSSFDRIAIKMGIHELEQDKQQTAIAEVFRVLKRGGIFSIWEITPLDCEQQRVIHNLSYAKNKIAGYARLAKNRYWAKLSEYVQKLKTGGFSQISHEAASGHNLDGGRRLRTEFSGDVSKVQLFNDVLRQIPRNLKNAWNFQDVGDSVSVMLPEKIIRAKKE
jgi:ubiquinone/menaquinone biosynthesis C-methylase UbiE